jgi:hypothetical protein
MEEPPKNKKENKEGGVEKFPTKEEIISFIDSIPGLKNPQLVNELSDEKGLYSLNILCEGDNTGETILCEYTRRRTSRLISENDRIGSQATKVDLVYYQNGQIYDGVEYAEYNEQTGDWKIKD